MLPCIFVLLACVNYLKTHSIEMAFHGHIGEFNPSSDSWSDYIERLDEYFTANDITPEDTTKRRAILLSACGTETYI